MKTSDTLETAGFYSAIRRYSGPYMNQKEGELCEKVTAAFNGNKQLSYGTNEERNARLALTISRKFLGNQGRIVNGYQTFFEVPHTLFSDYIAKDLVKGLTENDLVNNSESAIRYSREFFSSLEKQAAEYVGEEVIIHEKDPFDNIAGYSEEKEKIKSLVEQIKDKKEMSEKGLEVVNFAILHGPPGTGKTSLAKAVSESAGINFFSYVGTDFHKKYVGEGTGKINSVFTQAKNKSPSVIFIDEVESCFRNRSDDRNTTDLTSTFLPHIDGMKKNDEIIVIAATNVLHIVDKALIDRAGDYIIEIPLPNASYRKEIFDLKFSNINFEVEDYNWLIPMSEGWSGRDIHKFVQSVGRKAYRENKDTIEHKDLEAVIHDFIRENSGFEAVVRN